MRRTSRSRDSEARNVIGHMTAGNDRGQAALRAPAPLKVCRCRRRVGSTLQTDRKKRWAAKRATFAAKKRSSARASNGMNQSQRSNLSFTEVFDAVSRVPPARHTGGGPPNCELLAFDKSKIGGTGQCPAQFSVDVHFPSQVTLDSSNEHSDDTRGCTRHPWLILRARTLRSLTVRRATGARQSAGAQSAGVIERSK